MSLRLMVNDFLDVLAANCLPFPYTPTHMESVRYRAGEEVVVPFPTDGGKDKVIMISKGSHVWLSADRCDDGDWRREPIYTLRFYELGGRPWGILPAWRVTERKAGQDAARPLSFSGAALAICRWEDAVAGIGAMELERTAERTDFHVSRFGGVRGALTPNG